MVGDRTVAMGRIVAIRGTCELAFVEAITTERDLRKFTLHTTASSKTQVQVGIHVIVCENLSILRTGRIRRTKRVRTLMRGTGTRGIGS
jgi:hypothetical protein